MTRFSVIAITQRRRACMAPHLLMKTPQCGSTSSALITAADHRRGDSYSTIMIMIMMMIMMMMRLLPLNAAVG
jgi:hypothetical protein